MGDRWLVRMMGVVAAASLAACASVVGSSQSSVSIRTNPEKSHCELKGGDGFTAQVETPAVLSIPSSAAPVTVTCKAAGFRPSAYTLDATADGWIWGNSAFMIATGGVAVLGALVDGSRGAGKSYADEVQYDLSPDRPRPIRATTRGGETDLNLYAR